MARVTSWKAWIDARDPRADRRGAGTGAGARLRIATTQLGRKGAGLAILERRLSVQAGRELEAQLPRPPGSLLEQAERSAQRVRELEGRVGELQMQLDQRDREILALRDSLRKTIRERNTGT
ncbi:MAG: hypothetical protein ACLP50_11325 [Solirubrobacteraceae bacterium]